MNQDIYTREELESIVRQLQAIAINDCPVFERVELVQRPGRANVHMETWGAVAVLPFWVKAPLQGSEQA